MHMSYFLFFISCFFHHLPLIVNAGTFQAPGWILSSYRKLYSTHIRQKRIVSLVNDPFQWNLCLFYLPAFFSTFFEGGRHGTTPPPIIPPLVFVWIDDLIVELLLVDGAHAPGQIDLNLGKKTCTQLVF